MVFGVDEFPAECDEQQYDRHFYKYDDGIYKSALLCAFDQQHRQQQQDNQGGCIDDTVGNAYQAGQISGQGCKLIIGENEGTFLNAFCQVRYSGSNLCYCIAANLVKGFKRRVAPFVRNLPPSKLFRYSLQAIDTVAAPNAYSIIRAQPMIQAISSPIVT